MTLPDLLRRGVSTDTVRSLARAGFVRLRQQEALRDPFGGDAEADGGHWSLAQPVGPDRELTAEQADALRVLLDTAATGMYRTVLLHGVTGSGKTELYLRLAAEVAAAGRRVLVLVPEIALTPAAAGQFRARFGPRVAIQHSALSDGERHDQWHRIRRGDIAVVVGTRSAVFAPLPDLGLIVVDEEHESSYKQDESPRYHGRDVAVMRGRMENALVVLGSATPSIESAANATRRPLRHPSPDPPDSRSTAGRRPDRRHAPGIRGRRRRRHHQHAARRGDRQTGWPSANSRSSC